MMRKYAISNFKSDWLSVLVFPIIEDARFRVFNTTKRLVFSRS